MMQVCPSITQAILIDFNPCRTGMVSLPTVWSQIDFKFAFKEKDSKTSFRIIPENSSHLGRVYFPVPKPHRNYWCGSIVTLCLEMRLGYFL